VARLRETLVDLAGSATPLNLGGFDVAYLVKARRTVFRKADTQVRLLARFVPQVDAAAVEEAWPLAAKSGTFNGVICLMLIGTGVSPARELGAVILERRRRTRMGAPIVVAVDVRDWEALLPPEAPEIVRRIVHRLRDGAQGW
jgi:hypothetical protein